MTTTSGTTFHDENGTELTVGCVVCVDIIGRSDGLADVVGLDQLQVSSVVYRNGSVLVVDRAGADFHARCVASGPRILGRDGKLLLYDRHAPWCVMNDSVGV